MEGLWCFFPSIHSRKFGAPQGLQNLHIAVICSGLLFLNAMMIDGVLYASQIQYLDKWIGKFTMMPLYELGR